MFTEVEPVCLLTTPHVLGNDDMPGLVPGDWDNEEAESENTEEQEMPGLMAAWDDEEVEERDVRDVGMMTFAARATTPEPRRIVQGLSDLFVTDYADHKAVKVFTGNAASPPSVPQDWPRVVQQANQEQPLIGLLHVCQ
ncbi:hypothetical protein P7C70_g9485, partial [Phenoliferia sp. Uapishka_3]